MNTLLPSFLSLREYQSANPNHSNGNYERRGEERKGIITQPVLIAVVMMWCCEEEGAGRRGVLEKVWVNPRTKQADRQNVKTRKGDTEGIWTLFSSERKKCSKQHCLQTTKKTTKAQQTGLTVPLISCIIVGWDFTSACLLGISNTRTKKIQYDYSWLSNLPAS